MVNIQITDSCSLNCSYCISQKTSKNQNMDLEDFCNLLEYLSPSKVNLGITGGEPTEHPEFEDFLAQINYYNDTIGTHTTIFTNGINLKPYLPYISNNDLIVLNCSVDNQQQKEILDLLPRVNRKVAYKCNLQNNITDYSSFWNIVKEYRLQEIQLSLMLPIDQYIFDKEKYYIKIKPIFLQFCKDAIKNKCKINLICNHIPYCYFTLEEREIVNEACGAKLKDLKVCPPDIIIDPDWNARMCWGCKEQVNLSSFDRIEEVERYLQYKSTYPRTIANNTGKCTICKQGDFFQCQGGCLYFADI